MNRRGRRLYYAAHGDHGASEAWVFCNPFLEEKVFSHPVYVAFAREIARATGFALRFDYEGDGDSEGNASALSLDEWGDDVEDACFFARERFNVASVSLFGLRLGAAVAWLSGGRIGARRLLLWDPVVNGAAYFQDCLRVNLTTQLATHRRIVENREQLMQRLDLGETINLAGYEVGTRMAESITRIDLSDTEHGPQCPTRVIAFVKPSSTTVNREPNPAPLSGSNLHVDLLSVVPFWQESKYYDPAPQRLIELSLREVADGGLSSKGALHE